MVIREHEAASIESVEPNDLVQRPDESTREFEARAFLRLRALRAGHVSRTIFLVCNDRNDLEALASRTTLCRAALALLLRTGGGEVVLVTHPKSGSRSQILALEQSLNDLLLPPGLGLHAELGLDALRRARPRAPEQHVA